MQSTKNILTIKKGLKCILRRNLHVEALEIFFSIFHFDGRKKQNLLFLVIDIYSLTIYNQIV